MQWLIKESMLAERCSLPQKAFAEKRKTALKDGVDWKLVNGCVVYSEIGVRMVLKALDVFTALSTFDDILKSPEPDPDPLFTISIIRLSSNRRILYGQVLGEGLPVMCQVPSNENFIVGMSVKAEKVGEAHYKYSGRCPRWKGRW